MCNLQQENYNWTTTHNPNLSEFDFGDGYKIIHDKKRNICYKTKDGISYESFSVEDMKIDTFENILFNFLKSIK